MHVLGRQKTKNDVRDRRNKISTNRGQINGTPQRPHSVADLDEDSGVTELKLDHRREVTERGRDHRTALEHQVIKGQSGRAASGEVESSPLPW